MSIAALLARLSALDVRLRAEDGDLRINAPKGAMTPELADELARHKAEIVAALESLGGDSAPLAPPAGPGEELPGYPLTSAQERLWFVSRLVDDTSPYNFRSVYRFEGALDADELERSFNQLIERHASLRTTFFTVAGEPRQRVAAQQQLAIRHEDLRQLPATERERALARRIRERSQLPFDLESGPLLRCDLFRLGAETRVLLIVMHHIVTDGWSLDVLLREISLLYRNRGKPAAELLPPLALQYPEYALWQRSWLRGGALEPHLKYWRARLAELPVLQLPTDHARPATQSYRGAEVAKTLAPGLSASIATLAQRLGGTLFVTLFSAFALLLHRYSGQSDIVVGTPVASRNRAELEALVGFFVNMLVLRSDLSGNPTFAQLVRRIQKATLEDFDHQEAPLEKLVDELQHERDLSRSPLFQVVFAMQNQQLSALELEGLDVSNIEFSAETTRFDFEAHVRAEADGLRIRFIYNPDLYREASVARLLDHYVGLLGSIAAMPDGRLSELHLLGESERRFLLHECNRTRQPYARDLHVAARCEAQSRRSPDALAVAGGDQETSYRQLNRRANRLADWLLGQGAGAGVRVALYLERSIDMVVAQLAILKTGSAYVPIDPEYPAQRLRLILEDTRAPVLLTQAGLRARVIEYSGIVFCLDSEAGKLEQCSADDPGVEFGADDIAYVMYTSGSTGVPKGVEVTHGGLANLVSWHNRSYRVDAGDRATHLAGLGFDASVWELWPYLCAGASVHLVPEEQRLSPSALLRWMVAQRITLSFVPTPLAEAILREPLPDGLCLRVLLTGGDRLHGGLVDGELPFRVVNHYGPTENTVVATSAEVDFESPRAPPIGRPIDNVQTYVLDQYGQPAPIGVAGELYIGGDSLARGYLDLPDLSAEKFVVNPLPEGNGEILYRSGDIARYREDGEIEFIGRGDHQVKLRGFRIELGEIEAVLKRIAGIDEAAVLLREDSPGGPRLVAYYVAAAGLRPDPAELSRRLADSLPAYMVPSALVALERMPLTASGKVDRNALPAAEPAPVAAQIFPRNDLESRIAAIWKQVLGTERVGIHDNFFNLGGNSLLLAQVHERLAVALGRSFPILDLFRYPTVSALAAHLAAAGPAAGADDETAPAFAGGAAAQTRPIAIVGVAGRFPGAADVDAFWQNLRDGVESITHYDDEQLRALGVPEALIENPDFVAAVSKLDGVDQFDARFFGYSPRQAQIIDPQHRLFLECAWELLERAGYSAEQYPGRIGVYGGVSVNEYADVLRDDPELAQSYSSLDTHIGNDRDFMATRVSYNLNINGPAITLLTSCSTSLVAAHLAVQGLRNGDCDMAIVGGSTIRNYQARGYVYQEGGIMSPDGHCRAFDADARGTVGGDGTALLLLKRLQDALDDGDQIYAQIKGSAINNDGAQKTGYTAPSVQGQSRVIRAAQRQAQVQPRSVTYVEAHGTGTTLGDPIEIAALTEAFGPAGSERQYCAVGSLKTNVGHLESAAGAAGLIKTALALWHRQIPPSLHYRAPNPEIDFANSPFFVNRELRPWQDEDGPLRAGVSSFGIGGTNAHLVLEQAPEVEDSTAAQPWQLLLLSARSAAALQRMTENLQAYLRAHPDVNLADLAYTLQLGRNAFDYRRALVCRDAADALDALESRNPGRLRDAVAPASSHPAVFMFSGQGAQYPGMGRHLYRRYARYRETLDYCCEILAPRLGFDLRTILLPPPEQLEVSRMRLDQTEITQCALFVTEYALARLWMSWGIEPAAMIGHSIGEYVAACLSGVMSLDDALAIVATRGRLMGELPAGAMLAVTLGEAELEPLLDDALEIASVNGAQMCAVSGPRQAIDEFAARLESMDVQAQRLHTSHAFHSAMMAAAMQPLADAIGEFELHPPEIPYLSNPSGDWITAGDATRPGYYAAQLRRAVRFNDGLEKILAEPGCSLLEVGPGHTLASLAKYHAARRPEQQCIASLPHATDDQDGDAFTLQAVAGLWLAGAKFDWAELHAGTRRRRILLPTYPFERQRYWLESSASAARPPPADGAARYEDSAQWCYLPAWKSAPRIAPGATPGAHCAGRWLLLQDRHGLGERLAAAIEERGGDVIRVTPGAGFRQTGPGRFEIDASSRQDYDALLAAPGVGDVEPDRLLHLWGLDAQADAPLDDALLRGYYSLLYTMQAVTGRWPLPRLRAEVVTDSAHSVTGGERLRPQNALAHGLCKVLRIEYPSAAFRIIDVASSDDARASLPGLANALFAELAADCAQAEVALRGGRRWLPDYQKPGGESLNPEPCLRERGVYLITGGLGNVGLVLAEHLAESVCARLVLVARRELPPREQWERRLAQAGDAEPAAQTIRRLLALEAKGAEIMVAAADVAERAQMQAVIDAALERFGAIHGVIHAAGVVSGPSLDLVQNLDRESCELQFRPKVRGLVLLQQLFAGRALDFMMPVSSISSVLGGLHFAAYAAANRFMDAFAQQRFAGGEAHWISVGWDGWDFTAGENRSAARGSTESFALTPAEGRRVFARVLRLAGIPQVVISSGELQARIDQWIIRPQAMTEDTDAATAAAAPAYSRPQLSTEYVEARSDAERCLADIWQQALGIEPIGIHDNFFELGGDSVLNIQITARAKQAGLQLTPKDAFRHQTIAELAAVAAADAAAGPAVDAEPAAGAAPEISDEDLSEILRQQEML